MDAIRRRHLQVHFLEWKWFNPIKISMKFVPRGPINNIPALVQIMAWRRPGGKPLSEPILVRLPTHICVTRPQWVNMLSAAILRCKLAVWGRNHMTITVESMSYLRIIQVIVNERFRWRYSSSWTPGAMHATWSDKQNERLSNDHRLTKRLGKLCCSSIWSCGC